MKLRREITCTQRMSISLDLIMVHRASHKNSHDSLSQVLKAAPGIGSQNVTLKENANGYAILKQLVTWTHISLNLNMVHRACHKNSHDSLSQVLKIIA